MADAVAMPLMARIAGRREERCMLVVQDVDSACCVES